MCIRDREAIELQGSYCTLPPLVWRQLPSDLFRCGPAEHVTQHFSTSTFCHVMLCYVMLCYVLLSHVVLCSVVMWLPPLVLPQPPSCLWCYVMLHLDSQPELLCSTFYLPLLWSTTNTYNYFLVLSMLWSTSLKNCQSRRSVVEKCCVTCSAAPQRNQSEGSCRQTRGGNKGFRKIL